MITSNATVPIIALPQNINIFSILRKFELGLCSVCFSSDLDIARNIGKMMFLVKLTKISWNELKKTASVSITIRSGMFWKEEMQMNLTISMIVLSQHLDSLTI